MSKVNILILAGKPFDEAKRNCGEYPDFLAEHNGKPLIESIINQCNGLAPQKIICLFSETDAAKYHLRNMISQISPVATVIPVRDKTMGAACTALLASGEVENDDELLIVGSNEFMDTSMAKILAQYRVSDADAGVVSFRSIHPRYSFVRLNSAGDVVEAAEKNPISSNAITGTFWFKHGKDFVAAAKNMIRKDTMVDDAFFIAPALNELILNGQRIATYRIEPDQYHPLKSLNQIQAYEIQQRPSQRVGAQ